MSGDQLFSRYPKQFIYNPFVGLKEEDLEQMKASMGECRFALTCDVFERLCTNVNILIKRVADLELKVAAPPCC